MGKASTASHKDNFSVSCVAGGTAGIIEILITFPLEYVKAQLQLQDYSRESKVVRRWQGTSDCMIATIRERGPLGLYRGISSWLFFAFPRTAVRFSVNEFAFNILEKEGIPASDFLAGTFAGCMESLIVATPMNCIQVKMLHDSNSPKPAFRGFFHALYEIPRREGVRGYWGGLFSNTLKIGTNSFIRFGLYGNFKKKLLAALPERQGLLQVHESAFLGGVVGFVSAFVTHPIDVVKTNMQGLTAARYRSSLDCGRQILSENGMKGLFRGISPRATRVFIENALLFMLYEQIREILIQR